MPTMNNRNKASRAPVVMTAGGRSVTAYTLADPEVAQRIEALTARLAKDQASSLAALKKIGILNRSGKLSKNFGGR